jgi:phospholipase C
LNEIYEAVVSSPAWRDTVLVINYDEWGGFYEHVPPPLAPVPPIEAALGNDGLLGFRVPAMVISPWARRGVVDHGVYDHASILKMIEWRWGLTPLTSRDANAKNLAEVLDFGRRDLAAPQFNVPEGFFGFPCIDLPDLEILNLTALALQFGFIQ